MSDYVDGSLSDPLKREIDQHVEICHECHTALAEMRQLVRGLGALSERSAPVDCWPDVREAIIEQGYGSNRWLSWFARPVAWVPAFALTVVIALMALLPLSNHVGSPARSAAAVEYKTYMSAHSRVQRQQPLNDPDVAFITAELESASYTTNR
jgi:anti-sigma factor RsiW